MHEPVYKNNSLHVEDVPVSQIAEDIDTPVYIYSRATICKNLDVYFNALKHSAFSEKSLLCYAVKANSNLSILRYMAQRGAGFDIVSGGELERVLLAGGDPEKIVFSGVGKCPDEISRALDAGIYCFNVESGSELWTLEKLALQKNRKAGVSLRVNPDVDAGTHAYISTGLKENKFGIAIEDALPLYLQAARSPSLKVMGVDCHIGSQLTSLQPFLDATDRVLLLVDSLEKHGIRLSHIDMGGGLGVSYQGENVPSVETYVKAICDKLQNRDLRLILEPGRSIIADAGILLTKVILIKKNGNKQFVVTDAGMNDMMRPALYHAEHRMVPVSIPDASCEPELCDIVGPVCETSDCFAKGQLLSVAEGSYLAMLDAGAYGMSMASNYNSRPRGAEVIVDGKNWNVIRCRETMKDMLSMEMTHFSGG